MNVVNTENPEQVEDFADYFGDSHYKLFSASVKLWDDIIGYGFNGGEVG